jgi:predicted transcriptional regulator
VGVFNKEPHYIIASTEPQMKAKNNGVITKANTDESYTIIPNSILQSQTLTFDAKGVLSYLLSLPTDWSIVKSILHEQVGITEYRLNKAFKELVDKNYITTYKKQTQSGWVYTYNVYPTPFIKTSTEEKKETIQAEALQAEAPEQKQIEISNSIETLNTEMKEFEEQQTTEHEQLFSEFESYINTNTWVNDNYYIADHRIETLTQDYDYDKLVIIKDHFQELRDRKQLVWKDYKKIEDKLKWLHHYQHAV